MAQSSGAPTLEDVLKDIEKASGKGALMDGVKVVDIPRVKIPAHQLNLAFTGGGCPRGRIIELFGAEGGGKALKNGTGVLTPTGYVPIEQLGIGDLVASTDGKFYPVTGVFPQGKKPCYDVSFTFGFKICCSEDHIWNISRDRRKSFHDETLSEILQKGIQVQDKETKDFYRYEVELPDVQPLEMPEANLPVDPYLLGCLIGDGDLTGGSIGFTTADQFIVAKISDILAEKYGDLELRRVNSSRIETASGYRICCVGSTKRTSGKFRGKNWMYAAVKRLGLDKRAYDKHIPKQYLSSSIAQRQALLAGLMDTDGYIDPVGAKNFTTVSKQLAEDVKYLGETLGYRVRLKYVAENWYSDKSGKHKAAPVYSLDFRGEGTVCTLPRKVEREQTPPSHMFRRNILKMTNAEYVGDLECTCISVAAPNHLYITENCIPTHNTTSSLIIAAGFQKEDERKIFYVDAEGTYDPLWAKKLGVDNDRVILWRPTASTAEEVFQKCLDIAESDGVSLIIVDSFPALVPQNVEEKDMTELTMAGISKPLSTFSQKMTKVLLRRPSITVIGLNQVRDNMSQYGDPLQTPGGHAWKHFCSVRMQVKSTPVDDAGKEQPDKSDTATGVRIWNYLKKNKTGPRDWKTTSYIVNFISGFNPKLDLIETALMLGVVEQRGASYSFTNQETGEVIKAIGKRAFIEKLSNEDVDWLEKVVLDYSKPKSEV